MQPGRAAVDFSAAFQFGWRKFTENIGAIAVAIVVWFLALVVIGGVGQIIGALFGGRVGQVIASLFFYVAQFVGGYALLRAGLALAAGRPLNTSEMFKMDNFVPYAITSVVVSLIISVGSSLFILPGLIAWFLLYIAPYHAAETGAGLGDTLTVSFNRMKDNAGPMILFFLGSLVMYAVGLILCFIGIFVAVPVVFIASAYMYRALMGEPVAA